MQTTGTSKNRSRKRKLCDSFFADNLTPFIHGLSTKAKICLTYFKICRTYFELCALYFFFTPIGGENSPEKGRQIMIAEILLKSAGSVTVKKQVPARGRCRHLFGVFRRSVYA